MWKALKIIVPLLAFVILIIWFWNTDNRHQFFLKEKIRIILEKSMETTASDIFLLKDKQLCFPEFLLKYYKKNNYSPVWVGIDGQLPVADSLIAKIKECVFDGLNPSDYHLPAIETLQKELLKYADKSKDSVVINKWIDFELLLSDAFYIYVIHQYAGRIHTKKYNTQWKDHIASTSVIDSLKYAVEKNRISETISSFSCIHPQYKKLKMLLRRYIEISKNGGWTLLPEGIRLKSKDKNAKVVALRKRLSISGELTKASADSVFDNTLEEAVKKFQRKHGLTDNGTIDIATLNELNVPVGNRIKQIVLNMEKWRWFSRINQQPYILVNTAGFRLDVIENNESIMNMKIVTGMYSHRTPIFNADMTYLILNPWWEIPMSIARKEMLPEIKKDTSYFTKNNIKIYKSWKHGAEPVPADSIEWDTLDSCNFNYRFRQTPGPWNAMGQIKFMLPNKYNIYIHDTPNKELFSKMVRTFSHGCIRIEQPVELAAYLLYNDTAWTKDKLVRAINSKNEQIVVLANPLKVYVCYHTVWVDQEGSSYFWKDIYTYDKDLKNLLSYPY